MTGYVEAILEEGLASLVGRLPAGWWATQRALRDGLGDAYLREPVMLSGGVPATKPANRVHRYAYALLLAEDSLHQRDAYDMYEGALLVPLITALANLFDPLNKVNGGLERLDELPTAPSAEVESRLFELAVAARCAWLGRKVEFLPAVAETTPEDQLKTAALKVTTHDWCARDKIGKSRGLFQCAVIQDQWQQWTAAQGHIYNLGCMEVYKRETRKVIRRFRDHRLSFPDCIAALDAALADLTLRLPGEQIAAARGLILENNDTVMKEMSRRGPRPFDPKIMAALGDGITVSDYRSGQVIYAQGDSGEAVFYIQKGRVKLTAVSKFDKKAVTGVLGAGSFVGEGCLRGQPHAVTATVMVKSSIMRLDKSGVVRLLSKDLAFSELFLAHLLSRNLRMEEDMISLVLNSHEKRLARALLLLANFGKKGRPKSVLPKMSLEALAQMVGSTISRVSYFMKKFRKLGFLDYNGELKINSSLLNVVLHDQFVSMPNDPFPVTQPPHRTLGRRLKVKDA